MESPQKSPRNNSLPVFGGGVLTNTPASSISQASAYSNFPLSVVDVPAFSYSSSLESSVSRAAGVAARTYGSPPRTIDSDFRLQPRTIHQPLTSSRKRRALNMTPPSSPHLNLSGLSLHSPKCLSSPASCFTKVASSPASSVVLKSPKTEFSSPKMVPLTVLTNDSTSTPQMPAPKGSLLPLSLSGGSSKDQVATKETPGGATIRTEATSVLSTPKQKAPFVLSPRPKKTPIKGQPFLSPRSAKLTPVPKITLTPRRPTSNGLPRFPSPGDFVSPAHSTAAPPESTRTASTIQTSFSLDVSIDESPEGRNASRLLPFPDWDAQPVSQSVLMPCKSTDELDRMIFDTQHLDETESLTDEDEFLLATPGDLSEEKRQGRKLPRLNLEDKNHATSYTSLSSCNSLRGIKFAPSASSLRDLGVEHGMIRQESAVFSVGLTLDDASRDLVTPPLLQEQRKCPPPPPRCCGGLPMETP